MGKSKKSKKDKTSKSQSSLGSDQPAQQDPKQVESPKSLQPEEPGPSHRQYESTAESQPVQQESKGEERPRHVELEEPGPSYRQPQSTLEPHQPVQQKPRGWEKPKSVQQEEDRPYLKQSQSTEETFQPVKQRGRGWEKPKSVQQEDRPYPKQSQSTEGTFQPVKQKGRGWEKPRSVEQEEDRPYPKHSQSTEETFQPVKQRGRGWEEPKSDQQKEYRPYPEHSQSTEETFQPVKQRGRGWEKPKSVQQEASGSSLKQSQSTSGFHPSVEKRERGWEQQKPVQQQEPELPLKQSRSTVGFKEPLQQKDTAWGRPKTVPEQKPRPSVKESQSPVGLERAIQDLDISNKSSTFFDESSIKIIDRNVRRDKIIVVTNYYAFNLPNFDLEIYHYNVTFMPDKPKYLLRPVWEKFSREQFPKTITVFDGKANVFSRGPLIKSKSINGKVSVQNVERSNEKEFEVEITEVRRVNLSVLKNTKENCLINREEELTVLNCLLREWPSRSLLQRSAKFFFDDSAGNLSDLLELRRGIFQSVVLGSKLFINFDVAHAAFYKGISLIDCYHSFQNKRNFRMSDINDALKGLKIEYIPINKSRGPQTYMFNQFVDNARNQTFTKDGNSMSVEEYFIQECKYKLKYPNYPLLWVGSKNKTIYLPMELCYIAKNQLNTKEIQPMEQREMIKLTTYDAKKRREITERNFRNSHLNITDNPVMKEFGFTVSKEMERVEGHVLKPPVLQAQKSIPTRNGVWETMEFLKPKSLNKWCILNLDKYAVRENLSKLENLIKKVGKECGMSVMPPVRTTENVMSSIQNLRNFFSSLKDIDLVFVVISDRKEDYSRVKTICETEKGILTQCIKGKTLTQDFRKISTTIRNILMKVNAKLGGENQKLEISSVPSSLNGYTMVVGADVTHPRPGSKMPSVAAVAVSYDPNAFKYSISYRVQIKEIIKDLEDIMTYHVKQFFKIRRSYPEKILFFRDGVSEGQFKAVLKEEVLALERACSKLCQPKITVLVVQKRHHTRLYPSCDAEAVGKNFNVPVGTCVDTEIVSPRNLDFYLISHSSILGTARPTRYRLLRDDNKFTDYELEKLCYYLCYLCSRCQRSISYPSPTYYAHLGAFRAKSYLEEIIKPTENVDVINIQSRLKDEISNSNPMFFV